MLNLSIIISNNFYNLWNFKKREYFRMIKVEFLGPIEQEPLELEAKTLAEVANALQEIASINSWLEKCAVAVNDEMTNDLNRVLKSGDRVSILPPVCGG